MKQLVLVLLMAALVPAAIADSSQTAPNGSATEPAAPASSTTVPFKNRKAPDGGSFSLSSIPEPGTLCLLGTSLLGVAGFMRRRLRAKANE